jgi:predicted nucleotidyltransferase component of viral defense system
MIPQSYITVWRKEAPWSENYQVEQDLIIQRALIDLFKNDFIRERLALRGGTAVHKLLLSPAARYPEDIDLVQILAKPFGAIIKRKRMSPLSGKAKDHAKTTQQCNNLLCTVRR